MAKNVICNLYILHAVGKIISVLICGRTAKTKCKYCYSTKYAVKSV